MNSSVKKKLADYQERQEKMIEQVQNLSIEQANFQPHEKSWSTLMVLHHLDLVENGTMAYIKKKMLGGTSLPYPSLKSRITMFLFLRSVKSNFPKAKAPEVVARFPEDLELETVIQKWIDTRASLNEFIMGFPQELWGRTLYKHPFGGRGHMGHMLAFLRNHQVRHFRQIDRILKQAPQQEKVIS